MRTNLDGTQVFRPRWKDANADTHEGTFPNLEAAQAHFEKMQEELAQGGQANPVRARQKFGTLWTTWMKSRKSAAISTRDRNIDYYESLIGPKWGNTPLNKITRAGVNAV